MADPTLLEQYTITATSNGGTAATVSCEVTECTRVGSPGQTKEFVPACKEKRRTLTGAPTYVLRLAGVQGWEADDLCELLAEAHRTSAEVTIVQTLTDMPSEPVGTFVCTVPYEPNFGGPLQEIASWSMDLPMVGAGTVATTPAAP